MPHPTINPKRTVLNGGSIAAATITAAKLASAAKRNLTVVALGNTVATATNVNLFRAPSQGATIKAVYISPGSTQTHAVNESDTWIFGVYRLSATAKVCISKNVASLSGQTLAATSWKSIPVNGGYSTLVSGNRLRLEATISGTPIAFDKAQAIVEWEPLVEI